MSFFQMDLFFTPESSQTLRTFVFGAQETKKGFEKMNYRSKLYQSGGLSTPMVWWVYVLLLIKHSEKIVLKCWTLTSGHKLNNSNGMISPAALMSSSLTCTVRSRWMKCFRFYGLEDIVQQFGQQDERTWPAGRFPQGIGERSSVLDMFASAWQANQE